MSARVLLFTGKGGVGKSTTAAATALRCADAGARTMVLSTDPAHSLADAYDVELGDLSVEIAPGLWGQQIDTQARMEDAWVDIQAWLLEVFEWAGVRAIEAEELSVVPGLDEIFSLSDINTYAESGDWDVIVVDCAPTAETLRLLSLPEVLRWYMDRVFPTTRKVNRVVSPILGRVTGIPTPGDDVFSTASRFYDRLDGVRDLLCDTERTSVRLVVNPERLVVAEARRTHTYLSLFGYQVDAVVANRLLPEAITDPWFTEWKARHAEHLPAHRGRVRSTADPAGRARRRRGRRRRRPALVRRRALRRARSGRPALRRRTAAGRAHGERLRAAPRPALRRPRRPRPGTTRRRAAHPGRRLPAGAAAARLAQAPTGGRGLAAQRAPPRHLCRRGAVEPRRRPPPPGRGAAMTGDGVEDGFDDGTDAVRDDADPRVQEGIDHLQRAARELIAASRAFLDVVEEVVDRPDAVQDLLGVVGSLGRAAGRTLRPDRRAPSSDDDDDPPVQRIPVS